MLNTYNIVTNNEIFNSRIEALQALSRFTKHKKNQPLILQYLDGSGTKRVLIAIGTTDNSYDILSDEDCWMDIKASIPAQSNDQYRLIRTTPAGFASITKDPNTIYFVDHGTYGDIYKGDVQYNGLSQGGSGVTWIEM